MAAMSEQEVTVPLNSDGTPKKYSSMEKKVLFYGIVTKLSILNNAAHFRSQRPPTF
jgi:hypothetical protein